jgi:hypothetical protein
MNHVELFAGLNPESVSAILSKLGINQSEQYQQEEIKRIKKEFSRLNRSKNKSSNGSSNAMADVIQSSSETFQNQVEEDFVTQAERTAYEAGRKAAQSIQAAQVRGFLTGVIEGLKTQPEIDFDTIDVEAITTDYLAEAKQPKSLPDFVEN